MRQVAANNAPPLRAHHNYPPRSADGFPLPPLRRSTTVDRARPPSPPLGRAPTVTSQCHTSVSAGQRAAVVANYGRRPPRRIHQKHRFYFESSVATTTGLFAPPHETKYMSRLREALGNLPDAVFVDLLESEDEYLLVLDVPGVTADTLDVRVDGQKLVVDARREKDVPADFEYRTEERSLFLDVELPLPLDATDAGSSASVESGVLEVRLPKQGGAARDVPIEG